jgi:hypothetical protein
MKKNIELEIAHEIDVAWLIALKKAIGGGDPGPEGEGELTELLARSFATQLGARNAGNPAATIANLSKLGIKVRAKIENEELHLENAGHLTKFRESFSSPRQPLPRRICIVIPNFGEFCWTILYKASLDE